MTLIRFNIAVEFISTPKRESSPNLFLLSRSGDIFHIHIGTADQNADYFTTIPI